MIHTRIGNSSLLYGRLPQMSHQLSLPTPTAKSVSDFDTYDP